MSGKRTVRQFAREMGVHPNTVYNWIHLGLLPCLKPGGTIRIRESDILEFNARCTFDARMNDGAAAVMVTAAPSPSRDPFALGAAA